MDERATKNEWTMAKNNSSLAEGHGDIQQVTTSVQQTNLPDE